MIFKIVSNKYMRMNHHKNVLALIIFFRHKACTLFILAYHQFLDKIAFEQKFLHNPMTLPFYTRLSQ